MTFLGNLPADDEIVSFCKPIELEKRTMGIRYGNDIWVKFGTEFSYLAAEVQAQTYAFRYADRSTVCVPEVYHRFQRGDRAYILTEYIEGESPKQYLDNNPSQTERWDDAVFETIRILWEIPVPDNARPGPIGGDAERSSMGGIFL